jgi:hypothetical protein
MRVCIVLCVSDAQPSQIHKNISLHNVSDAAHLTFTSFRAHGGRCVRIRTGHAQAFCSIAAAAARTEHPLLWMTQLEWVDVALQANTTIPFLPVVATM